MQIQTTPDCSGAPLDSKQSKMSFILCPTPAALCVEPGSSLLCLDRDAVGQHSHLSPLQAALSWLCCSLPALPQPAPAPALGVAAGQPCPARHLLAHGNSVLLQLVLPAQARTWLLLWSGKLRKHNSKGRWRMQMCLQLRDQNLGCWKPPSPTTIFHFKNAWVCL